MTDCTAAEMAAEALRAGADYLDNLETILIGINADMKLPPLRAPSEIAKEFHSALAALTAEAARVSPDREALARRLEALRIRVADALEFYSSEVAIIDDALAFIRLPAQAEVEAMAKRLEAVASLVWEANREWPSVTIREAASLLHRFASLPPAVGEWRPAVEDALSEMIRLYESQWSDEPPELIAARNILRARANVAAPPQETKP